MTNRPDQWWKLGLIVLVLLIVLASILRLTATSGDASLTSTPQPVRTPQSASPAPTVTATPDPAATRTAEPRRENREKVRVFKETKPDKPPVRVTANRKAIANRFLESYLLFAYGQTNASALRATGAKLQRELAAAPPRTTIRQRNEQPRVTALAVQGHHVTATVRDSRRVYTIPLTVQGGQVTAIQ